MEGYFECQINPKEWKKSIFHFFMKINQNFSSPIVRLDPHTYENFIREIQHFHCFATAFDDQILGLLIVENQKDALFGHYIGKIKSNFDKQTLFYANTIMDMLQSKHSKDLYTYSSKNRKSHKAYLRAIKMFYDFELLREEKDQVVLVRKLSHKLSDRNFLVH